MGKQYLRINIMLPIKPQSQKGIEELLNKLCGYVNGVISDELGKAFFIQGQLKDDGNTGPDDTLIFLYCISAQRKEKT